MVLILDTVRAWLREVRRLPGHDELGDVDCVEDARDLDHARENAARLIICALADLCANMGEARAEQEVVDALNETVLDLRHYAHRIEIDIRRALGQPIEECLECGRPHPKDDA